VAGGFKWDFGDGTSQTTQAPAASHTYSQTGSFTVEVTVNGATGSNCPTSCLDTTISVTTCKQGGSMPAGCWALLIAALILSIVGAVLGIIAACTANYYLGIAAGIIGVVALILLILWLILCARGHCDVFNWVRWIVIWILMAAVIVGIIVAIVGGVVCGGLATAILWSYWGVVLAILDIAGPKIGCPLVAPPWP
jgi:PKD repeat protein